jgi:transcriptional regulator with XRE-family HTH domain
VRLGNYLRDLRENLGLMQKSVANKLGISNKVLSNYENDVRIPDLETFTNICKYYNVSADTLLGLNTSNNQIPTLSEKEKKILLYYNRLVVENKEYIIGQMIGLYKEQQKNIINKQALFTDNYNTSSIDPEIQKELDSYRKELLSEKKQGSTKKVN